MNTEKLQNVQQKLEGFLAQEKEQKERAQRCFISYLRSVYLMKNKEVFDVFQLQIEEYAQSLGLAVAPRVRFLNKAVLQKAERTEQTVEEESDEEEELKSFKVQLKGPENESSDSESVSDDEAGGDEEQVAHSKGQLQGADYEDDLRDVDLLTVKRKDVFNLAGTQESLEEAGGESSKKKPSKETKYKEAKKVLKKNFQVNKKVIFNEDDEAVQLWPPVQRAVTEDDEEDEISGINVEKARERLKREDQEFDKLEYSRKVKAKHRERKVKAKAASREARKKRQDSGGEEEDEVMAYLAHQSEEEFDPSTLPDPDKLHSEEEEVEEQGFTKRQRSSGSSDEEEEQNVATFKTKKRRLQKSEEEEQHAALDTGLSLAEDEELVLHLLRGSR